MSTALRKVGLGGITGNRTALFIALGLMALMLLVPTVLPGYQTLFRTTLIFVALAYGWNMIGGYTGYVSFGNMVFFGLGTYCAALLSARGIDNLFADVGLAVVVNAAFAAIVGFPVLRLKGHYFGIATLGTALAVTDIVGNLDVFGGTGGLALKQVDEAHFSIYYYAAWIVAAAAIGITFLVARSKLGYAFVAIRENEDAAAVLGISATKYKIIAWAISAAIAGAAGAVYARGNGFIDPVDRVRRRFQRVPDRHDHTRRDGYRRGSVRRSAHPVGRERDARAYVPQAALAVLRRRDRARRAAAAARSRLAHRAARRDAHVDQEPAGVQGMSAQPAQAQPAHEVSLRISDIGMRFGGLWALSEVSFDVERGSVVGLIGPNGSGKTTLMNVISGVYKPTTGAGDVRGPADRRCAGARSVPSRHRADVSDREAVRELERARKRRGGRDVRP